MKHYKLTSYLMNFGGDDLLVDRSPDCEESADRWLVVSMPPGDELFRFLQGQWL